MHEERAVDDISKGQHESLALLVMIDGPRVQHSIVLSNAPAVLSEGVDLQRSARGQVVPELHTYIHTYIHAYIQQ